MDGHALDDWLEAKAEVLGVVKDPRKDATGSLERLR
jgi:hypothetical protein